MVFALVAPHWRDTAESFFCFVFLSAQKDEKLFQSVFPDTAIERAL